MKRKVDIDPANDPSDYVGADVSWWDDDTVFIHQTEKESTITQCVVFERAEAIKVRDALSKFIAAKD